MKKKIMVAVAALSLCAFVGCGSGETKDKSSADSKADNRSNAPSADSISMDDLPWNVEESIDSGERYVMMDYTNNTEYAVSDFKITFKAKSSITEDEKNAYFTDLQNTYSLTDEDMEELKVEGIAMSADYSAIVEPGASSDKTKCYYYTGVIPVTNLEHYNIMEPDIATIQYVDGEKIYTVYYDFASDKYSVESETEDASYWTDTEMGTKVPKPESKVIKKGYLDRDDAFDFEVLGVSEEDYNSYVAECKTSGYTENVYETDDMFYADSTDNYRISVDYDESNHSMDVTVQKNDEESSDSEGEDLSEQDEDWDMEDEDWGMDE